eukprot:scaffold456_cov197-Alexandrium_tamarense.AAC.3
MISDDADCTIGCWEDGNRVDWMRVGANCGGCGWFGLVDVPPPGSIIDWGNEVTLGGTSFTIDD